MRPSQVKKVLVKAILARKRILLVGAPGLGKTALIKWAREEVERIMGTGIDLTTLYVSISDPTDFKGFYCIINGKPEIMPFGELEKIFNATSLHIVFLDDFGQGAPAVQAAAMSFLDRVKDNPNICVLGATNRREDRANVSGMLEPVKSRFDSIIHMEYDNEDWVEWALEQVQNNKMPIELVAFNKFRPKLMYSVKPSPDLVNGPCPRTVESLGHLIMLGLDTDCEYETYCGAVGEGFTAELMGFLPIWKKLPNIDTILMNPDSVTLPTMDEPFAPSIYFAVCNALSLKANENTIERILKFSEKLPPEFAVSLVVDCVKKDVNIQNTKAYIIWQSKNKDLII
jgi:hypothetical protein